MASQAEVIRANQERTMQAQLQQFGGQPVEELANGIPATSNDAVMAAYLKETRDSSQEYAKLRTEEARQQWEAIATDNARRTQSANAEMAVNANIAAMNSAVDRQLAGDKALSEWGAVVKGVDPANDTEWTLGLDKLRDIAVTQQKVINTTGIDPLNFDPGKPPRVNPQDAGTVTQNPDGTWKVQYQTGEIFTGDAETVMRAQAAGAVNTKLWARQQRQIAEQAQAQQTQPAAPAENLGQEFTPSGSLADDLAARQRESVARSFGFSSADEMISDYQSKTKIAEEAKQFLAEAKQERAISTFFTQHGDFPGSDEANNALGQIIDERGWEVTAENLEAAHAIAVQRGMYEPISAEALSQANGQGSQRRAVAPPMLRTNNPEITNASPDPYNMPLADLRRQAIAQELNGGGQNYR